MHRANGGAADGTSLLDWPVSGGGEGLNSFLRTAGIADGLIAYTPQAGRPRSIFVVGLQELRETPRRMQRLVEACDRWWAEAAARTIRLVDLAEPESAPAAPGGGTTGGLILVGNWTSPLDGFCQAVVHCESGQRGLLQVALLRRAEKDRLGDGEQAWLRSAMPLFLEAMFAFGAKQHLEQRWTVMHALFDQMITPTMIVDPAARPLMCNRAAAELLERRDELRRTATGAIAAADPRADRTLRAAIAAATAAASEPPGMQAVRLTGEDCEWRLAIVMPAPRCAAHEAGAAAIVVPARPGTEATPACILSALGLLPSEQRFLDAFLNSSSLTETAERANLSPETARTYLKRVRAKLGAHRQMDLARLLQCLVPAVAPAPFAQL